MRILILGGTSGIGLALARHYLARGEEVAVCGRDLSRLPAELGAQPRLQAMALDITDHGALASVLNGFAAHGLDLLVVCAGFYFNTRHEPLDAATTLRMLLTNLGGLGHAFELAAEKMLAQKSGHLVAISSVAGLLHDYPGASLYSATKRSVLSVCDSYRAGLKPFGIAVTAIVPGYVDTAKLRALNGGDARHKPFILSEAQAVAHITRAIEQRQAVCVFPWQMRWLIGLLNCLPSALLRLRR
ncbi:SDR family NAD(P)-dependent oxidoreductase [Variovorax sp. HJSM1_2]|uniref:SDR family NAD(P)-dependent oxidoreductase n=1 Tax=Variovorax sp. HJSM1_2 TaxID=3366263 RepID=UPI003BEC3F66